MVKRNTLGLFKIYKDYFFFFIERNVEIGYYITCSPQWLLCSEWMQSLRPKDNLKQAN